MRPLIIINHNYKFIIVLNPKSGCSTIRDMYIKLHLTEFPPTEQKIVESMGEAAFHASNAFSYMLDDTDSLYKYKNYFIFSFIRNTYNRICSAFFNRYLNIQYELEFKGIENQDTFMDFLNKLPTLKEGWDLHYKEQIIHSEINEYIDIEKKNIYDEFIRIYKKLNIDDKIIQKLLNLKEKNVKKETAKKYICNKDLSNYNFCKNEDNIQADNNGIPSYNCILNKTTISMIKDIYAEEISFFKFESPIEKLKI